MKMYYYYWFMFILLQEMFQFKNYNLIVYFLEVIGFGGKFIDCYL